MRKNGIPDALLRIITIAIFSTDVKKETNMFKLFTLIGSMAFFCSSWLSGFALPRITNNAGDYLLMPLCGYITIIMVAQIAARIIPEPAEDTLQ
jgi:hypothetical protein